MKNRIAELRKARKFTLRELAEKLGVSEGYVSQLQEKKALHAAHRAKLAQIFGVPAGQVVDLDEKAIVRPRRARGSAGASGSAKTARTAGLMASIAGAEAAVGAIARSIDPQAREFLGLMAGLSPANRNVLLTLARSLAGKG